MRNVPKLLIRSGKESLRNVLIEEKFTMGITGWASDARLMLDM